MSGGGADSADAVFFLGFQKTGTTSVHRLLNTNAALLPDIDIRAYGAATEDLRRAGVDYTHWPTVPRLDRLRRAMEDHAARFRAGGRRRLVISDENIVGRVAYNANGHLLDWCARVLPMLETAFAGFRLRFVFHIREPGAWLRSYYNQSVRRTRVSAGFEDWVQGVGAVDWPAWQARLQAGVVSPVEFRRMEDDLSEHGFLGATLLDRLGVDRALWPRLTVPPRQNPSVGDRDLRLLRAVNRLPVGQGLALDIGRLLLKPAGAGTK